MKSGEFHYFHVQSNGAHHVSARMQNVGRGESESKYPVISFPDSRMLSTRTLALAFQPFATRQIHIVYRKMAGIADHYDGTYSMVSAYWTATKSTA